MRRSKSDYVIQTVTNALRLLEAFDDEEELGVTELSRRLELHKNNVFRLLATLEEMEYVEQCTGSDRYRLGLGCLRLGQLFSRMRSLPRQAREVLSGVALEPGECAHVGVLAGFDVVHVDGERCGRLVGGSLRIGDRLEAHCTSLGKVLLADADAATWQQYDKEVIRGGSLPERTSETITDREKFFEHLRAVAAQGFALDVEECEQGLSCVAAPVHDASGAVVAALSISAPAFCTDREQLHDAILPRVQAAAAELSRRLGH